jgi:hypothetical protein
MRPVRCTAFVTVFGAVVALAAPAMAQGQRIGQIKTATGQAFVVRGEARLPAKIGDPVYESDVIETGAPGSSIGITFIDNTVFSTGPETQIALSQFRFDSNNFKGEMLADVKKGSLSIVSGDITRSTPGAMKIKTPTAILGVSGTTFAVKVY